MNTAEMKAFEKAYENFIIQIKRKRKIKIEFYLLQKTRPFYGWSFIGYVTTDLGLYGIHFDLYTRNFYFGTRNSETGRRQELLYASQERILPRHIMEALIEVATSKSDKVLAF